MLNIFADALLLATRMDAGSRYNRSHHDGDHEFRDDTKIEVPSRRYVFPKLGL